jgi:hypothetical protein
MALTAIAVPYLATTCQRVLVRDMRRSHSAAGSTAPEIMSEYDSGDDLFDGVDVDALLSSKRPGDSTGDNSDAPNKRPRVDSERSNTELARRILKEQFGYDSFRHEQEQVIGSILAGSNTLAVFPTGAGKSLCYQASNLLGRAYVQPPRRRFSSTGSLTYPDTCHCL